MTTEKMWPEKAVVAEPPLLHNRCDGCITEGKNEAIDSCRAAVEEVLDREKIAKEITISYTNMPPVVPGRYEYYVVDRIIAHIRKELW